MQYWESRFSALGSVLKMYGVQGDQVDDPKVSGLKRIQPKEIPGAGNSQDSKGKKASEDSNISGKQLRKFDINREFIDNNYLNGFTVFFQFDKMGTFNDAEYMTKLDIATEIKNRCEFEFFQDVNGQWIFKPPFYNLNTKYVPSYRIDPSDVINQSFQTNAEEVTTVLEVQIPFHPQLRSPDLPSGRGFHIDIELAKRYGVKFRRVNLEYIRSPLAANMMAMGHLAFLNAKAFTGSITIPGRPELRLGYPIYLSHRDSFHYVKSISHSFDYGSAFTTSLALEAERARMYDFKNGAWDPEPQIDKIYLYKGAGAVDAQNKKNKSGQNGTKPTSQSKDEKTKTSQEDLDNIKKQEALQKDQYKSPWELSETAEKTRELLQSTGRIVGVEQGRYDIVSRDSPETAARGINPKAARAVTQRSIPFTDEEGYRHIGSFRYGRGIPVSGGTVIDEKAFKDADLASPDQQVNDSITNMNTSAQTESVAMKEYADLVREGREGIIPAYLQEYNIRTDLPNTADIQSADADTIEKSFSKLLVQDTKSQAAANEKKK